MQGTFPLKTKDFTWKKSEKGYAMVDKESGQSVNLDPVSFLVWIQCDGKTSITEIIDVFSVGGNRDVIEGTIKGVLEKMTASGMIEWV